MRDAAFQVPVAFDYVATFMWAVSGALVAIQRRFDIVGVFIVALLSAIGGGFLRDVAFLNRSPAFLGDPAERIKMFQAAEKILVEDVPAVFVYHGREIQYIKPWVEGEFITPDSHDISAVHWPGYTTMTEIPAQLYIGNSAPDR